METEYLKNIQTLLGKEDKRYFSKGFKFMNYKFENIKYFKSSLFGNVHVKNSWLSSQKKHLHLGTIEYIAITGNICESILYNEFNLTDTSLASSWIRDFKIKITKCTNLIDYRAVPFSAKIESTVKENNSEFYLSSVVKNIGNNKMHVNIVHPILLWNKTSNRAILNREKVEINDNYKLRDHEIKDVIVSTNSFSCKANVLSKNCKRKKSGLEGNYKGPLLTDIIKISGQLMEVLFYKLYPTESQNRKENIWLKEFSVSNRVCCQSKDIKISISFDKIFNIIKNGENWKTIQFSSKIGGTSSIIKVVTKMSKKQGISYLSDIHNN